MYTCGPYGQFENEDGELYAEVVAECQWNKTWSPPQLDLCKGIFIIDAIHSKTMSSATACLVMPMPPKGTGLIIDEGPSSSGSYTSI